MFPKLKFGIDPNSKQVKITDKPLQKIKELREQTKDMSFEDMRKRISEMKAELSELSNKIPKDKKLSLTKVERQAGLSKEEQDIQKKLYDFMPEVYAFVDEVFSRKIGFRYHDVQLRAAITLSQGQRLVELFTGEGKTMTFQLPLILYSLVGRGAHLITVNDYLSRRDGEYAGHVAVELGLSLGIINSQASYRFIADDQIKAYKGEEGQAVRDAIKNLDISNMDSANLIECSKTESYNCDITYGTNNEFGFDYLRDNMAWDLSQLSQRELYFCIIDEADSILIDEARTPLIISGVPSDANTNKYQLFAAAVEPLEEEKDFVIDHKSRSVSLTEEGIKHVENNLGIDNLWNDYSNAYHIENALKAKSMFKKDDEYMVKNGEVLIVDEFTGRVLKGRRYSEGLHQAIEAKEKVQIQQESKTYATITFQNFFRLYKVLCGGSGTIMTEAEEFFKIYGLESVNVPTNKPVVRVDHKDRIYKSQDAKFKAVVAEIKERNALGQPILVGTTSVDRSEIISHLLDLEGIPHEVLNAKYHEQEAKIIERAGRRGAVTVATNMAGRGADIVIGGGRRGDAAWKEIADIGGLHVIGTERHESRRIDNQLRGRTGRQGEPGSSRFYVALDDTLMKILGGDVMSGLMDKVGMQDDMPIEMSFISRQIEMAQKRIENINFDSRKRVVDYDDVMNQHREIFYSRRRKFLNNVENSSGKFIDGVKVIDINTPEYKDKIAERKDDVEEARAKVKSTIEKIFVGDVKKSINDYLSANPRLNEDKLKKIMDIFATFVPAGLVAPFVNVREGEAYSEILKKVKTLKNNEILPYFADLAQNAYPIKVEEFGEDFYYLAKVLMLQNTDNLWVDHLELMKDIREGIGLQAYAQKDPLVEYKNEAFIVFSNFIDKINSEVAKKILNIQKVEKQPEPQMQKLDTNVEDIQDILDGDREFIQDAEITSDVKDGVRADSVIKKAIRERDRNQSSLSSNRIKDTVGTKKNEKFENIGRNDKVSVRYKDGKELKDVKYKKVEQDVKNGDAILI
ncbi:MAG: preprotein translocase subunit SecA [Candidatus Dojkabacteria bacterium]